MLGDGTAFGSIGFSDFRKEPLQYNPMLEGSVYTGPAIYDTTPIFPSLSYNTVIVQQLCRIQDNDALLGDVRGIARGLMEVCRRALERCALQSREGVNVQRR